MPVKALKRGPVYRIVEAATGRITRNKSGTSVDGGGHKTREKAMKQASAINRKG